MKRLVSTLNLSKKDWLRYRKCGITGTDAGAILGLNPYRSAFQVYHDKISDTIENMDNEAIRQGRALEDYVAQRFSEETGFKVRRANAIYQSEEHPLLLADFDRLIVGQKAGLECKTVSPFSADKWADGKIPAHYLAQVDHYLAVSGFDCWYIAALIFGKELVIHKIISDIGDAIKYFEPRTIHNFISELVRKVIICHDHIEIKLQPFAATLYESSLVKPDPAFNNKILELKYPVRFGQKRGRTVIVEPASVERITPHRDEKLFNAVTQAFYWKQMMEEKHLSVTELARRENIDRGYMGQIIRLTTLAPDIIMAIINGTQPKLLNLRKLLRERFPYFFVFFFF